MAKGHRVRSEFFQSKAFVMSECASSSLSVVTKASWVSAPACITPQQCFLVKTVFRRAHDNAGSPSYVPAAQLKRGDMLLGPAQSTVQVLDVRRSKPRNRDIITIETHELPADTRSRFSVTSDHRVLVEGSDGKPVPQSAHDLKTQCSSNTRKIFNGVGFVNISSITSHVDSVEVVDVCFDDPGASVLAWLFPGKHNPRSIRDDAAFACLGRAAEDRLGLMGVACRNTFILDGAAHMATRRRCCSEGVKWRVAGESQQLKFNPWSNWSVGSQNHTDADPSRCRVCIEHRRFLRANAGIAVKPCRKGPRCKFCHGPH